MYSLLVVHLISLILLFFVREFNCNFHNFIVIAQFLESEFKSNHIYSNTKIYVFHDISYKAGEIFVFQVYFSRSGRGVQNYVIKFVSDLQQVGGFSPGPPVSSINKTDHHDITEILLKW
jgi:hypothetical protein